MATNKRANQAGSCPNDRSGRAVKGRSLSSLSWAGASSGHLRHHLRKQRSPASHPSSLHALAALFGGAAGVCLAVVTSFSAFFQGPGHQASFPRGKTAHHRQIYASASIFPPRDAFYQTPGLCFLCYSVRGAEASHPRGAHSSMTRLYFTMMLRQPFLLGRVLQPASWPRQETAR